MRVDRAPRLYLRSLSALRLLDSEDGGTKGELMSRARRERRRIELAQFSELDAIYARIPKIKCKRLCQDQCTLIAMTGPELKRIRDHTGRKNDLIAADDPEVLVQRVLEVHRNGGAAKPCPKLTADGSCSAYAVRPLICRLYGLARKLACPHGCEVERMLTDQEAVMIMRDTLRVSWASIQGGSDAIARE